MAHELAANCLENDRFARDFIGLPFAYAADGVQRVEAVTESMAAYVDRYCERVREAAMGKVLFVEQRLSIAHITGEDEAAGTADVVIIDGDTIEVRDLKYGMGVQVSPVENPQLMIYALAAVDEFAWAGNFTRIRLTIDQVRLGEPVSWDCWREELEDFREEVIAAAKVASTILANGCQRDNTSVFSPDEHTCRFCRAAGQCEAQTNRVLELIAGDFEVQPDLTTTLINETPNIGLYPMAKLGATAEAIPFFKDFIKAVEQKLNTALANGVKVPGWKLVQGRAGNSKWADVKEAVRTLLGFGLSEDDIYEKELLSPTTAKKKWEKKNPEVWSEVKAYVTRSEGKPNAVPDTDPRPEYTPPNAADDFSIEMED